MPKRPRPRPRPAGLIAELPLDERPRERLLRNGPKALTDAELVAILLKNGRPGASVLEVAREILVSAGGLPGLAGACARSLRRNGVGQVKLATLLAAVEIASYRFFSGDRPGGGGGGADDPYRLTLAERILVAIPDSFAQGTADSVSGFGDTISFGLTEWAREEQGLQNTVDTDSTSYTAGEWTGYGWFAATGAAGAGRAATAAGVEGRVALHGAHHSFGRLGRLPHIQLNVWRSGVKGSGSAFRIPLPKWIKR